MKTFHKLTYIFFFAVLFFFFTDFLFITVFFSGGKSLLISSTALALVKRATPVFLVETALNTQLDQGTDLATRRISIEILSRTNEEKFLEVAFKILENPNENNFGEVDTAMGGYDESNVIGQYVYRGIINLPHKYIERAHKKLYSLLDEHHNNEAIVERITPLLYGLRREVSG